MRRAAEGNRAANRHHEGGVMRNVGDKVQMACDIYEAADDHSPGGYLASKGEAMIIRAVDPKARQFPYSISHPHITDNSFGVTAEEIEDAP
jgi:hypothetical protein